MGFTYGSNYHSFPRTRGGDPKAYTHLDSGLLFSPHTRG